jgi:DNA polymerase III epsilon subunit-like protein
MAIMNQPDFSHTYAELMTLLATEASAAPTTDAATLQARYERRHLLSEQLSTLERTLYDLRRRIDHLPWLPDLEQVRWAQALLAFPNLAFLEVDTDGLNEDADILRIVLVDNSGTTRYDQTFKPPLPIDRHITHLTALTLDMVEDAPRLVDEWERVTSAFAGHYILSYNLEFDQTKLRENAERYRLPPLTVVGTCFMQQAQAYFGGSTYPKLATLCAKIGFPLPDHPSQTAFDRVRGQMHLLEAMAQGITSSSSSHETPQHEQNDDPFAVE